MKDRELILGSTDADVDRVIDFLAKCQNADICAGVGQLLGLSSKSEIEAFRNGLKEAMPKYTITIYTGGGGGPRR